MGRFNSHWEKKAASFGDFDVKYYCETANNEQDMGAPKDSQSAQPKRIRTSLLSALPLPVSPRSYKYQSSVFGF